MPVATLRLAAFLVHLAAAGALVAAPPRAPATPDCATPATSGSAPQHGADPDSLEAALDRLRRAYGVPGLVAAWAEADGRIRTVAIGATAPGGGTPMPEGGRMLAGSIGKSFVAATVLALDGEGTLALDDPVERWVGERRWFEHLDHGPRITPRHLLTHTAGIPDHVYDPEFATVWAATRRAGEPPPGPDLLIGLVADDPALFAPGEGWSYSDTGYLILGLVVEAATGRPLFDEVRTRLLQRLGLEDTAPSDHPDLDGLVAGWVDPANPFGLPRATLDSAGVMHWDPGVEGAGGGLISTAADLVRWGRALFSGEALGTPYLDDLLRGVPTDSDGDGVLYGAGVSIRPGRARGPVFGHAGAIPGYLSTLRHYPRSGVTFALQINTDGPFAGGADAGEVMAALEEAMASHLVPAARGPEASEGRSPAHPPNHPSG
jgi:D-alanyl-D-alanine carboxypeptidase